MTKALSKVLAIILSLSVLLAMPVMANAEETATFAVTGSLYSVEGDWDDDYVETIAIEVKGDFSAFADDASVRVFTGEEMNASDLCLVAQVDSLEYLLAPGSSADGWVVTLYIPFKNYINHAETYTFFFEEGTFVAEDGTVSEELAVSVTGNEIVEALEVEHVSTKPIEKLIDWMYTLGAEGFWLDVINFIVSILEWFLYI